ncbi:hypothetical protein BGX34_011912 [Mortierella sp. NVP85]|nr:hypothetical protein BGX34_011912 [Mortierella sp. NVP85]
MAHTHPLEIQEIIDLVVSYLRRKDLTICIRVSKSWRDKFLPHIWRIVRAGINVDDYGVDHPIGPKRDTIDDHRQLIQDLTLVKKIGGFNKYHYPNMRRLVIDMNESKPHHSQLFMNLTTKAPMLVDLTLAGGYVPSTFWIALSKHPHLEHLSLAHLTFKAEDAPRLWRTCMRLESLRMEYVTVEERGRPRNMVFDRLRQLTLGTSKYLNGSYLMDVMLQSPMIESLELHIGGYKGFRGSTMNGDWVHLKKLYVYGNYEYVDLAFIFKEVGKGLGNVAVMEPYRSGSDIQVFKALGSHFSALVDVDLVDSMTISDSTVPDIMCLCPRLEKLQAKHVFARSVAERGSWVCHHLRELRIQFVFDEREQGLQQVIFERLSTLVQLEKLQLDYGHSDRASRYDLLELRLDCGLGRLASLQQLACVEFCTSSYGARDPDIGVEEVEWILGNWKRLKWIKGDLNENRVLQAQLWTVFEYHGIIAE